MVRRKKEKKKGKVAGGVEEIHLARDEESSRGWNERVNKVKKNEEPVSISWIH